MEVIKYRESPSSPWKEMISIQGPQGPQGIKGDTPKKGVDYYTEADIQAMVELVLAALPSLDEVSY